MSRAIIATLLFLGLILTGCSAVTRPEQQVNITAQGSLTLLPVPQVLRGTQITQLLRASYGDDSYELIIQLEFARERLSVIAMSVEGLPIFEQVYYSDGRLITHQFLAGAGPEPSYMLADIQLVHWPLQQLQYSIHGAELSERVSSDTTTRIVSEGGESTIIIVYDANKVSLSHKQRGYKLELIRLEE
ncbi:DUF3261 domain-containing protein [Pseudoalteromonas rubra]|uniref:DUF3261 domain-containing protein n=1 Tax=Pseudoalteromonas rubra TaxID=43658 RepID=UPI000F7757FE|nr:DUF3261 domain-containing protein [Pseudoalteromonas rubra]